MLMEFFKQTLSKISFNLNDYLELRPAIRNGNYRALRTMTLLCTVLFGALFGISFLNYSHIVLRNQLLYGINFAVVLFLYLISPAIVKFFPSAVTVLVYIFAVIVHGFGITIGVLTQVNHPATSYIVLLFVIPLFFIDRPWRNALFNFISCGIFLFFSYKLKSREIFFNDLSNAMSFCFLSIICSRHFTRLRIQQLKVIKIVETERDTDTMTGVLSKAAFLREIDRLLTIDSSRGIFIMIDVDNFKHFNDKYGHDFGDLVLQTLGRSMNNSFRRSDLLGRFGGDEFFVFIPSTNDTDVALFRTKSLQMHLENDIAVPGGKDKVTISVGISNCKGIGETYKSLMKRADEAIYEAKAAGKNTIVVK